jgi:hypothetical protein
MAGNLFCLSHLTLCRSPELEFLRLPSLPPESPWAARHSREAALNKIDEYHAAKCREMARRASPAHRQQLEQMAETWEQLAHSRQRQLHGVSDNSDGLIVEFELPPEDDPPKH